MQLSMLVGEHVGNLVCTELSASYPFGQIDPNCMIKQVEVRPDTKKYLPVGSGRHDCNGMIPRMEGWETI